MKRGGTARIHNCVYQIDPQSTRAPENTRTGKSGVPLMTTDPLVREVAYRIVKLVKRHNAPLRLINENGSRSLMKDGWCFVVERHVPRFWGYGGPQFGQIKTIQVFMDMACVFQWMAAANDFTFDSGVLEETLVPYLRNVMVLDDLARLDGT